MLGAMDSRKNPVLRKSQLNAEKFATELGNSLESLFLKHYLLFQGQKVGHPEMI